MVKPTIKKENKTSKNVVPKFKGLNGFYGYLKALPIKRQKKVRTTFKVKIGKEEREVKRYWYLKQFDTISKDEYIEMYKNLKGLLPTKVELPEIPEFKPITHNKIKKEMSKEEKHRIKEQRKNERQQQKANYKKQIKAIKEQRNFLINRERLRKSRLYLLEQDSQGFHAENDSYKQREEYNHRQRIKTTLKDMGITEPEKIMNFVSFLESNDFIFKKSKCKVNEDDLIGKYARIKFIAERYFKSFDNGKLNQHKIKTLLGDYVIGSIKNEVDPFVRLHSSCNGKYKEVKTNGIQPKKGTFAYVPRSNYKPKMETV